MMKKLLFINGHLKTGGCERSLTDLLRHLDYSKYEVDLLLVEDLGDYLTEIPEEVNVIYYDLKKAFGSFGKCMLSALKRRDWFSIRFRLNHLYCNKFGVEKINHIQRLFKKVKKHYDVIIAYRPGICTDLAAFAFSADKKISWWHHGEMNLSDVQIDELNKIYKILDLVVAVSESSKKIVEEYFVNANGKTVVIPNMVCLNDIKDKADHDVSIKNNKKIINLISVGRFSPEKNMLLCPEIGKELLDRGIDFLWYLIGDGEQYDETKQLVEKYELSDYFVFKGSLNNPYPYIKGADLLIHPSLVESQGLTVLEAMALGTPVEVVESEGPKEFIVTGENGFLVKPEKKEIADIIVDINNKPELLSCVSENAYNTVKTYSPEKIMQQFYNVIND